MKNVCPNCQHPGREGDRFCSVCGQPMPTPTPPPAPSTPATGAFRVLEYRAFGIFEGRSGGAVNGDTAASDNASATAVC